MRKRKLVFGIGTNDAAYPVHIKIDGKSTTCPYFRVWANMMKRCYCSSYHESQPTYIECSVCPEWVTFSNFKTWMESQDWQGKEIDKDILQIGNKVYSPETCMFVTRAINSLLNPRGPKHQCVPTGVYFDLSCDKWRAEFTAYGKKQYIGVFNSWQVAGRAYKAAKAAHIKEIAGKQKQPLKDALVRHAEALTC